MTKEQFDSIVATRCSSITKVLVEKAKEYASEEDRLHNFKYAGKRLNCSPERALVGMKEKHSVSVMDMIRDIENGTFKRDMAYINEKIGDEINYLILLEALLKERVSNDKQLELPF